MAFHLIRPVSFQSKAFTDGEQQKRNNNHLEWLTAMEVLFSFNPRTLNECRKHLICLGQYCQRRPRSSCSLSKLSWSNER